MILIAAVVVGAISAFLVFNYVNGADVNQGLTQWFDLYTHRRPHQGLGGRTPFEVYHQLPLA